MRSFIAFTFTSFACLNARLLQHRRSSRSKRQMVPSSRLWSHWTMLWCNHLWNHSEQLTSTLLKRTVTVTSEEIEGFTTEGDAASICNHLNDWIKRPSPLPALSFDPKIALIRPSRPVDWGDVLDCTSFRPSDDNAFGIGSFSLSVVPIGLLQSSNLQAKMD